MATMQQNSTTSRHRSNLDLFVGVFDTVQATASAVDRLVDAGFDQQALGLLMSDRTAQRHFGPPSPRNPLGVAGHGANVSRLSYRLKPVAALGTPGAGLVAAGPIEGVLVAAGLGTRAGLEVALKTLGTDEEAARDVARRVKNGAALVSVPVGFNGKAVRPEELLQGSKAAALELHLEGLPEQPPQLLRSQSPAGREDPRYAMGLDLAQASERGARRE